MEAKAGSRELRRGFTLVELLVVIAIIGILIGMLLPAVQSARESGRRAQCVNNLKQLALACIQHESTHAYYPTGGWAWYWSGDPDRGTNQRQPGGWTYNVLPFMEQQALHDLGIGQTTAAKKGALSQAGQTPLSVFYCPTRRATTTYPNFYDTVNTNPITQAARTDYAANAGTNQNIWWDAPTSGNPMFADAPGFQFPDMSGSDGVMFTVSMTTQADVRDGTAFTVLLGEKYLNPLNYATGLEATDNNPIFGGFDWDWSRWGVNPPHRDRAGVSDFISFGSAHVDGLNVFTCDGSGHWMSYQINPATFTSLCSRNDGNSIDSSKLNW